MNWTSGSQRVVHRPAASASSGKLLEMQNLWLQPKPASLWEWGAGDSEAHEGVRTTGLENEYPLGVQPAKGRAMAIKQ